jgi:hypothetical protein
VGALPTVRGDRAGVTAFKVKSVEMMRLCEVLLATIVEHVRCSKTDELPATGQTLQKVSRMVEPSGGGLSLDDAHGPQNATLPLMLNR